MDVIRHKIVLVDDDMTNLRMGRDLLKEFYQVYPAPSGAKLFEILENITPALILLDIEMPEMNGYEVLKKLKSHSEYSNISVILLTSKSDEHSETKGFDLGAVEFVSKPFSAPVLLRRISHQLRVFDLMAELKTASESKSLFLANMSHEIRTPMNAIIGLTELMLNAPQSEQNRSYLNDINTSSHALLGIINSILDFSKIEAGKIELIPTDYDFKKLLENLSRSFEMIAAQKSIRFILEEEGEIPQYLLGDDIKIRQILTNICGNAMKFTNKGHVKLHVSSDSKKIFLRISDTGVGISKDALPKLFTAFSQADTLKNRNIVGTGLGLTISNSFVELMGGEISVDSVYGEGTTFTIVLPFVEGNAENIKISVDTRIILQAPDAKIFVVDDNEMNLRVAGGLLRMFGIEPDVASSGEEAIRKVQEKDYEIVFMDHMMPDMDGVETTNAIRNLGGKFEELKIIALTANAIQGVREMFLSNGFDDFISKPIELSDLIQILKIYLPSGKIKEEDSDSVIEDSTHNSTETDAMSAMRKIPDTNIADALRRFSNDESMYIETVGVFFEELPHEIENLQSSLQRKSMKDFRIATHTMKAELAILGITGTSDKAGALEDASASDDLEFCKKHFPSLLKELLELKTRLEKIFS
ncbi:MAG: response regulator [Clostridiales bacterium]|jgi:signal transduction histidine kinase/HPt (histidine-containing phosphotransfer) domain-containing protein|nr:response regulator [Clostridiales bacterium]